MSILAQYSQQENARSSHAPYQQHAQKYPLRWFLLFWLGFILLQQIQLQIGNLMQLQDGGKPGSQDMVQTFVVGFVAFCLLMLLHCTLHWFLLFRVKAASQSRLLIYFLLQGLCVYLFTLVLNITNMTFGLCLALMIEAITLLQTRVLLIAIIGGYFLLFFAIESTSFLAYIEAGKIDGALPKLINAVLDNAMVVFFVIACFLLYMQQLKAHRRDQDLLRELESAHLQLQQTHDQLESAHIQLEDYAARVEDLTLISERQRMARELHDTLAQGLVGLTMQLETIDSLLLKQRSEQARTIVQQALTRARATITSARAAITNLRAEGAGKQEMTATIEDEIERFSSATGISCECIQRVPLPEHIYEHLQRIVSEGLTNIARHARASRVWIETRREGNAIILEVGDNGVGFDPEQVGTGHYGLLGLRERARLMQGQLTIISAPGTGTKLRLCVPNAQKEPTHE